MSHISIYTREGYRKQGFATLVASATVEHCLAHGIDQIGWHCWDSNIASAATAEKVGFRLLHDRIVYNGCWNQFDNLLLQAYYASQASRMQEAVGHWERAFEMWESRDPEALSAPHRQAHPEIVGWCYYAAGQARAEEGEVDLALAHLHKAVDNGWGDIERLQEDKGLSILRDTPEWDRLLCRAREVANSPEDATQEGWNMTGTTIRDYKEDDAPSVGRLIADTYAKYNLDFMPVAAQSAFLGPFQHAYSPDTTHQEAIAEVIRSETVLVAENEGEIVGVLRGRKERLASLFVKGDRHRQGIGRRLVEHFEQWSLERGVKVIRLAATLYGVPFYLAMGYKRSTGVRSGQSFEGRGLPWQPMRKVLDRDP
jgi:GNAT superfamily N-acetyltransferase